MNANKINEPILFIHGEGGDNSGPFPIQIGAHVPGRSWKRGATSW